MYDFNYPVIKLNHDGVFAEMHCKHLSCDLDNTKHEVKHLQDVESQLDNLKMELEHVNGRLKDTSLELDKSQAKNKSLIKHEQVTCI